MTTGRELLLEARESGGVFIPVTVGCGCRLHFGPTLDNGIAQPLRAVCRHRFLWAGTFLPLTQEALVAKVVEARIDEASYAVEPESWQEMYDARFGQFGARNDHGNLL